MSARSRPVASADAFVGVEATNDLAAIADAVAVVLGAATVVCDADFGVLTYSQRAEASGGPRDRAVLARRLPRETVGWIERSGIARANGSAPRIDIVRDVVQAVVAIRAGHRLLGYLWACEPQDGARLATAARGGDAETLLRDAAARLAESILRAGSPATPHEHRGALQMALEDDAAASALGRRVSGPHRLIVVDLRAERTVSLTEHRMLETAAALEIEATGAGIIASREARVYALVRDIGRTETLDLADRLTARVGECLGTAPRAVVTRSFADLHDLAVFRARAERGLAARAWSGPRVRGLEASSSGEDLAIVTAIFGTRPDLLHPGLVRLAELDRVKHSGHLDTLHAYLDRNCDLAETSRALLVHRNTVKYRLERIRAIAGIDLDRPDDRLMAELQVRYLRDDARRTDARPTPAGALRAG